MSLCMKSTQCGTDRLGLVGVLVVCGEVDGGWVDDGAGEELRQLHADGRRHGLVGWRQGRGHEEGGGLWRDKACIGVSLQCSDG